MWKSRGIWLIIGVLLLSACKTTNTLDIGNVSNLSDVKLRNNLKDHELVYDKLYLKKASFSFDDGTQNKTFKGSIVIKKDSMIVISIVAMMGIELVRVKLTPDEVVIVDKYNKKVFLTSYNYFEEKYGINLDYRVLQSILSNSLFIYPSENDFYDDLKKYKHDIDTKSYSFKSIKDKRLNRINKRNSNDLILHEFSIYPDVYKIFNVFIKDFASNQTLIVDYDNFIEFNDVLFPEYINLKGTKANKVLKISLKVNYLDINNGGSLHFKIPDSYKVSNM